MKTFTLLAAAALTLTIVGTAQAEPPKVESDPFGGTQGLANVPRLAVVVGFTTLVFIAAISDDDSGDSGSGTLRASGTPG